MPDACLHISLYACPCTCAWGPEFPPATNSNKGAGRDPCPDQSAEPGFRRLLFSVVRERDRGSVLAWLSKALPEQRRVSKRVASKLLKSKYSNSRVKHTVEAVLYQVWPHMVYKSMVLMLQLHKKNRTWQKWKQKRHMWRGYFGGVLRRFYDATDRQRLCAANGTLWNRPTLRHPSIVCAMTLCPILVQVLVVQQNRAASWATSPCLMRRDVEHWSWRIGMCWSVEVYMEQIAQLIRLLQYYCSTELVKFVQHGRTTEIGITPCSKPSTSRSETSSKHGSFQVGPLSAPESVRVEQDVLPAGITATNQTVTREMR